MKEIPLPEGVVAKFKSPVFSRDTLPEALRNPHSLGPKRWGALHILEGSVTFIDLGKNAEQKLVAPQVWVIAPESPHQLALDEGALRCRLELFEEG